MRKIVITALLLVLLLIALPGLAQEIIVSDGVHYELGKTQAMIVGFDEGLESATILPTFRGLPTAVDRWMSSAPRLIFAEGVTSFAPYEYLFSSEIIEISIPSSYDFAEYKSSRLIPWIEDTKHLETIHLPQTITAEEVSQLAGWIGKSFEDAQYALLDAEVWYNYDYDPEFPPTAFDRWKNRRYQNLKIHPDHPTLYDIDGVVFSRETNTLLAYLPGRQGAYTVPDGIKAIGDYAFERCEMLDRVTLPASVTEIGKRAFSRCGALAAVQLPPTLQTIGESAFSNCISLETIILPDAVTIKAGAFNYCMGLKEVYLRGNAATLASGLFLRVGPDCVLYGPENGSAYRAAAQNDTYWAEIGGTPIKHANPNHIHPNPVIVFHEDQSALLPLYAGPSESSGIIAQVKVGDVADCIEEVNGFARIHFYDQKGFLPLEQLYFPPEDIERVLTVAIYAEKKLYDGPSEASPYIIPTEAQKRFPVLERVGSWYAVDDDGTRRYILVGKSISYSLGYVQRGYIAPRRWWLEDESAFFPLREGPSDDSAVIAMHGIGTQYEWLLSEEARGTQYSYVSIAGQMGYIHDDHTTGFDYE